MFGIWDSDGTLFDTYPPQITIIQDILKVNIQRSIKWVEMISGEKKEYKKTNIKEFNVDMTNDLIYFFKIAYNHMGFSLELNGKDSDIKNIKRYYKDNKGQFWVIYNNNRIIGCIGLRNLDEKKKIGELKRFYILPEMQGLGFGKSLLELLIKNAEKSYDYIRLDTSSKSEKAIHLYEKYGFYYIERYNNDLYAELFMEKKFRKAFLS